MGKTTARPYQDIHRDSDAVHAWRVGRLTALGVTRLVAETIADRVDWHEVARLVRRGCPASLAVQIVK